MKYYFFTTVILFSILFLACSKDDSSSVLENEKEEENLKYRLSKIDLNHASKQPYYSSDLSFGYSDNGKIDTIQIGGYIYKVSYPKESLIELNLIEENISNVDLTESHKIYVKEGKVDYISNLRVSKFSSGRVSTSSDSLHYFYDGGRLNKIEKFYNKKLDASIDLLYKDGNIVKSTTLLPILSHRHTSNYEYDSNPRIELSDIKYESPIFKFTPLYYMFTYDKLGGQNKNNLRSISIDYDYVLENPQFENIKYNHVLDKKTGLLNTIEHSGVAKCDSQERYPDFYPSRDFNDIKVTFEYEKY
ncbi:hypothetical protein [Aquimarina longa]|uniref:hypothetical protein n=1 Tax=Aquimarina longa TaxID=1080221 RepID=UPI000786199C|nr:hypothetical protein [Aquimarina longa]